MFFSSNFLFLISLAFISWVILCYLNKIDESRDLPYRLEYNLEKSFNDALVTEEPSFTRNYQAYVNFFCIFTSIYVLAKLTAWVEDFFSAQVRAKAAEFPKNGSVGGGDGSHFGTTRYNKRNGATGSNGHGPHAAKALQVCEATFTIEDYRKLSSSLREEIAKMQKRNTYLEHRVRELEQHNLLLMGKGMLRARNTELRCDENGFVVITTNNDQNKNEVDGETSSAMNGDSDVMPLHVATNVTDENGVPVGCTGIVCTYFCYDGEEEDEPDDINSQEDTIQQLEDGPLLSVVPKRNSRQPRQQNIFIANRFFQLNRQVYVNEGSVKLSFQGYDSGDFTQIWQKYLEMQRFTYRTPKKPETSTAAPTPAPAPPSCNASIHEVAMDSMSTSGDKASDTIPPFSSAADMFSPEMSFRGAGDAHEAYTESSHCCWNPTPIVVSTEELETMRGLVQ